jgi:hypothetical protein
MSMSHCILLDHAHIGDQHIPTLVDSILLVYKIMSTSCFILLYHSHIGNQHIIPSFDDSIHLVLRDDEYVTLQTPRSCPHSRSTHRFLCRFVSLSTTRFMSSPRCILLHRAQIGDQQIIPSLVDSIHLVLQDYEHVTLHTARSCPHWRSTHPFLHWFDSLNTTRLWAHHVAYSSIMPILEMNISSLRSSVQFA